MRLWRPGSRELIVFLNAGEGIRDTGIELPLAGSLLRAGASQPDQKSVSENFALALPTQGKAMRIIGIDHEISIMGDEVHEIFKRLQDGLEVAENIGVIEFDARDYAKLRPIMKKLRTLVKKGGIVLIPFNNHVAPVSEVIAGIPVFHERPDESARAHPRVAEHPGQQGRGGALAVGPGNDNAFMVGEEKTGNGLGHGQVGRAILKNGLSFGIFPADDIPDNDDVR